MPDSDKFPTDFIPVSRPLAKELGYQAAYVFGVIWNYCQMEKGFCNASHDTIAERADMGRRTVMRHIETLIEAGYLEDLTPEMNHAPHHLCTKKGVEKLNGEAQEVGQNDLPLEPESPKEVGQNDLGGRPKLPTEVGQNGTQIESINRQNQEIKELPKGNGVEPHQPLGINSELELPEPEEPIPEETLLPDSPELLLLFQKINHNRKLKNWGPVKLFKSIEQKESFQGSASRLGVKEFEAGITKGLKKGITDLSGLVNWLEGWAGNKKGSRQSGQKSNRARQPGIIAAAQRASGDEGAGTHSPGQGGNEPARPRTSGILSSG